MKRLAISLLGVLICWGSAGFAEEISTQEQYRMIEEAGALVYASRDARLKNGDLETAEEKLLQALALIEKAMGPDHEHVATTLNDLALLKEEMGRYAEAEKLFNRALAIKERKFGAGHPEVASTAMNLAAFYRKQGQFAKAEPLLENAVRTLKEHLGREHQSTALALNNLGACYRQMGRMAEAESCFKESLEIQKQAKGPEDPRAAEMMGILATFYRQTGQADKAVPLLEESLGILAQQAEPEKPLIARQQGQLGVGYLALGDYAKAEFLLESCVESLSSTLGPNHASVGTAMGDLGSLYKATGRFEEARPLYEKSLKIIESTQGVSHPFSSRTRINLATTLIDLGERQAALEIARQDAKARQQMLAQMLSFTSETERLEFRASQYPFHLLASLNASHEVAETVLREKGVIIESLLEDRRVVDLAEKAGLAEKWNELRENKTRLRAARLASPDPEVIEKLTARVRDLDKELSRSITELGGSRRSLTLTVESVQQVLSADTAVVDFFQYMHYQGKADWHPAYGAVIWHGKRDPVFVSCGDRQRIDEAVGGFRKSLDAYDDAGLGEVSRSLHQWLIEPLAEHLDGVRSLVICPDGQLSFVSFASLLDADQVFLGEICRLAYAAGVRDLLKEELESNSDRTVLVGGPAFRKPRSPGGDAAESELLTANLRAGLADDVASLELAPLPGSEREISMVSQATGETSAQLKILLGAEASEQAVRGMRSPRILHFATHGFFLNEIDIGAPSASAGQGGGPIGSIQRRRIHNPMYRSGIALAGAQTTIDKWRQGEVLAPDNDGILMAAEVGDLDLRGTELVTLSACSTATGDVLSGEGVLGLRRGFVMAGARNLLMTLWPVADEDTADFMGDFYTRYAETSNAPESLADVQREWLVRLRKEKGLVHAVNRAGAFIMSSQGRVD